MWMIGDRPTVHYETTAESVHRAQRIYDAQSYETPLDETKAW